MSLLMQAGGRNSSCAGDHRQRGAAGERPGTKSYDGVALNPGNYCLQLLSIGNL